MLCGRERVLEVYDAQHARAAGARPAPGSGRSGWRRTASQLLYVTDVEGDALLVFHLRPRFELIRRVHVIGGPYAIAFDSARWGLRITLQRTGQVVELRRGKPPGLAHRSR